MTDLGIPSRSDKTEIVGPDGVSEDDDDEDDDDEVEDDRDDEEETGETK